MANFQEQAAYPSQYKSCTIVAFGDEKFNVIAQNTEYIGHATALLIEFENQYVWVRAGETIPSFYKKS